jgi:hypothetical protein
VNGADTSKFGKRAIQLDDPCNPPFSDLETDLTLVKAAGPFFLFTASHQSPQFWEIMTTADFNIPVPKVATAAPTKLRLGSLTALVNGSMVGSGVFSLPQNMAAGAGSLAILIGWAITAVGMLERGTWFEAGWSVD